MNLAGQTQIRGVELSLEELVISDSIGNRSRKKSDAEFPLEMGSELRANCVIERGFESNRSPTSGRLLRVLMVFGLGSREASLNSIWRELYRFRFLPLREGTSITGKRNAATAKGGRLNSGTPWASVQLSCPLISPPGKLDVCIFM